MNINSLKQIAYDKIKEHIKPICNLPYPVFIVSEAYPGIWLEHVYDSIIYGELFNDYTIAKNTISTYIDFQSEDGLYPYSIKTNGGAGYYQLQECVSILSLGLKVFNKTYDYCFLEKLYKSGKKWILWLQNNRMTRKLGLVEMFIGYDDGHDNSAKHDGMAYPSSFTVNHERMNASVMPKCDRAPIIAVDMNSCYYGNLVALSKIADLLNKQDDKEYYLSLSKQVKAKLIELCYDKEDSFFYDVDKDNKKHKVLSCAIFHLFQEHVLDIESDKELIDIIITRYIKNETEFLTPFPFPAVALSDKTRESHKMPNSWGYYSQALTAIRCSLWMDDYKLTDIYNHVLTKWVEGIIMNYDNAPFAQELDPVTGISPGASTWYSTAILLFIYATNRLKL